jgi:hypothetical protein
MPRTNTCTSLGAVQYFTHYATSRKVAGSIPEEFFEFLLTQFFRPYYGPGVDSASNRNEYQGSSLRVKALGGYG